MIIIMLMIMGLKGCSCIVIDHLSVQGVDIKREGRGIYIKREGRGIYIKREGRGNLYKERGEGKSI